MAVSLQRIAYRARASQLRANVSENHQPIEKKHFRICYAGLYAVIFALYTA